jgi:hypothetical protein
MKVARIVSASIIIVLTVVVCGQVVQADGWSLANMFTTKSDTTPKKTPPKPATKTPSAMEKMGTGTKKFFGGIGDTLSGKKTATHKTTTHPSVTMLPSKPAKKTTTSSWNPFKREEPKQPRSLKDFVGMPRPEP